MPPDLRSQCCVANIENGVLSFAISSSEWAMRFRYGIPELTTQLRTHANLPELSSIQYYVEPEFEKLFHEKKEKK